MSRVLLSVLSILCLCAPARAQALTAAGWMLESPTLVSLQVADDAGPAEPVRFTGDYAAVVRSTDPEWDGPGVSTYSVVFKPRDPNDPPAPFVIGGRRGTVIVLSWMDLPGVRCQSRGLVIDPVDFDGDLRHTVMDFAAFLNSYVECGEARWYDGDPACDQRDLVAFFAEWGKP